MGVANMKRPSWTECWSTNPASRDSSEKVRIVDPSKLPDHAALGYINRAMQSIREKRKPVPEPISVSRDLYATSSEPVEMPMYLSRHDEIAALAAPNPPSSKPVPILGKLDAELMTLRGADNESKSNSVPTWANLDLTLLMPSAPANASKPPSKNTQKRPASKRKARKKRRRKRSRWTVTKSKKKRAKPAPLYEYELRGLEKSG